MKAFLIKIFGSFAVHKKPQRDFVPKPRVARHELPWEKIRHANNPKGVAAPARSGRGAASSVFGFLLFGVATPLGLNHRGVVTQGSSFLATLGSAAESLWDSATWLRLSLLVKIQARIAIIILLLGLQRGRAEGPSG